MDLSNWRTQLKIALLVFCAGSANAPASAEPKMASIFTVSNVQAQADADNSVEAKKRATLKAETQALAILLSRITDYRSQSRLPAVAEKDVEQFVSDIDVRNEGVSGTTYVANFGVTFLERSVRGFLQQYGVTPIEDRGPEILIVPVYIESGAARTTDRNPWRNGLAQLDLAHALVPSKLAPVRGDLTAAIANAYLATPASSIEALKTQYKATYVMLAVAEVDSGGESLNLRLAGIDALGAFNVQRKVKSRDGAEENLMQTAAKIAFDSVQERWKLTRDSVSVQGATATAANSTNSVSGDFAPVQVTAQFSGLKEWQTIRTRLQRVPGVQNWDLKSVNPRSALIGFDFPGGAERLAELAQGQGLSVENGAEGWVVKTR